MTPAYRMPSFRRTASEGEPIRLSRLLLVLFVACSNAGEQATSLIETAPEAATTTVPPIDEGDLYGWELTSVSVGQEILLVAVANDPDEWAQGLMGVEDFGDLDGMLFVFPEELLTSVSMKNTPVPLDIAFFDLEGILVGVFTMEPCERDPCSRYLASGPFAWALETPAGLLSDLPPNTSLTVGDG